jgi:uncharacterized protein
VKLSRCVPWAAFLAAVLAGATAGAEAQVRIPARTDHPVHDYAGVIVHEDFTAMEALAREVFEKSRVAIVMVTIKSLEGEEIEELTLRWLREWGVGDKKDNRGILFLVAVGDRKSRIENGYGVEGYLPDGLCGQILDDDAIPYFKRGDYSVGARNVVERLALLTSREFGFELTGKISPRVPQSVVTGSGKLLLYVLIILFVAAGGPSALLWLLLGGRLRRSSRRGGRPWYWGSGGPFTGGPGGFGGRGGMGGGGFGGFGGGSGGGGGASRGW